MAGHRLALVLLGSPSLKSGDSPVHLSRRKSLALLAYLALEPGVHARDFLASLFWPDCSQTTARGNLRSSLLDIAVNLGADVIVSDRDHAGLIPGTLQVDALEILAALKSCDAHDPESACALCAPRLAETSVLDKGSFMQGFSLAGCPEFDDWQSATAYRVAEAAISLSRRLALWYGEAKKFDAAAAAARRWSELDPFNEEARLCLFKSLATQSKKAAAEECFRAWEAFAAKELGTAPTPEFLRLRAELAGKIAASPSSLVGRANDEAALRARLESISARVHTIIGPGGVGKTSLAKAVAAKPGDRFPDGSVFVDVSPIRDPALLLSELAAALGLGRRSSAGESLFSRVVYTLQGKRILIVLDNLEQIRRAALEIQSLSARCIDAVFLCTSRIALGLENEDRFVLAPLKTPDAAEVCTIEDSERYPALQLFMERARTARSSIQFAPAGMIQAARICARLEGLPLALELAASRLVAFTLEELDARIRKSTRVVKGREPDRPERHRSLHAAIAWSWELLEKDERSFLERLSVFAGGFTHETAERVCGLDEDGDLNGFLESLVEWRLVTRLEIKDSVRFILPEAIREFAFEQLEASGAATKIQARHAECFTAKARDLARELHGVSQRRALEAMEKENANFTAAMDWLRRSARTEDWLRLLESLEWYWYRSGRYEEGLSAFEAALSQPESPRYPMLSGRCLRAQAWLALLHGDWAGSIRAYERSVELLRQTEDGEGLARALSELGLAERWLGREDEGFAHCREGLSIARASGEPARIAAALIWLYANTGGKRVDDLHLPGLEEILFIGRAIRDPWLEAHAFQGLGDYYRENGSVDTSISCYQESLNVFEQVGEELMKAWSLEGLGMAELKAGRYEKAIQCLKESCAIFHRLGDRGDVAYLVGEMGVAHAARGEETLGDLLLGCACGILGGMTSLAADPLGGDGLGKSPRSVPSSLSPHFQGAINRGKPEWAKGLYLDYESAVRMAMG